MWRRLRNKLRYLWRSDRVDRDLARELDFHRDMLTEDQERLGRDHATAVLTARRKMGNTTLMSEHSRDAWIISWLDNLVRDVRYALRSFAKNPAFTTIALLTLALGIGANTAIFRLVDAVMLRSLPVHQPEDLLSIRATYSYFRFEQLRDRNQVFSATAGARPLTSATLTADGQPLGKATTQLVTGNYFSVLGVTPILGRPITPEDDRAPGAGPVAVIGYGLWQRAFGGSRDVLGRTIRVSDGVIGGGTSGFEPPPPADLPRMEPVLTIIGVAPPEFFGETVGTLVDVWVPITMQPILTPGRAWLTRRTASWVNVFGRLKPGITEEQARVSLTQTFREIRMDEIGPQISDAQRRNLANLQLLVMRGDTGFGSLRRQFSQPLLVLMTVVTLVLLIACLNVANLLLARATARRQEISMRLSLGAGRGRLIRQLLTESLLLAGTGGLLGLIVAGVGTDLLLKLVGESQQQVSLRLAADSRILAFTGGVSILCGLLFGLLPALRGTRGDLQHVLKESSRGTTGGRSRATKALLTVQIAVSLVLLVACGLFLRTLYNLKNERLGYDRTNLIMARMDPVSAGYSGEAISRAVVELRRRLAAIPGVKTVTFSENGFFGGVESGTSIDIVGYKPATDQDRNVAFDQAGPGYFTDSGIPIVLGRDFTERDAAGAPQVVVINETMAKFYFPNESPIGRQIHISGPRETTAEIVGVTRDVQDHNVKAKPVRRLYVSYLQPIDGIVLVNFAIRAATNPAALFGAIREETKRFDPKLQILNLNLAQTLVDQNIATERLIAKLSTIFGVLAVLLAAIGLYGVMSYTVARRTGEIGVRMALGASQGSVASMILREIVVLVAVGSIVGAAAALGLARFVESLLFGLAPRDPVTLVAAAALLLLIGLIAGYLPARRASRIDPIVALRAE